MRSSSNPPTYSRYSLPARLVASLFFSFLFFSFLLSSSSFSSSFFFILFFSDASSKSAFLVRTTNSTHPSLPPPPRPDPATFHLSRLVVEKGLLRQPSQIANACPTSPGFRRRIRPESIFSQCCIGIQGRALAYTDLEASQQSEAPAQQRPSTPEMSHRNSVVPKCHLDSGFAHAAKTSRG